MRLGSKRIMRAVAALAVAWLAGVVFAASGGSTPSVAPSTASVVPSMAKTSQGDVTLPVDGIAVFAAARAQAAAQSASGGKPQMAEDVFKNIQVLKGTTVDEFMGTMGLMAAALGYCCANCHTGAGTQFADWGDDSFAEKRISRRMVSMVQAINRTNFGGRQVVTCWTCHRGRDVPVMTPPLDAVYGEAQVDLDDILTPAEGVPTVDAILDKYYQAIGGAQKVATLRSFAATGKSVFYGGFGGGGEVEMYARVPDQRAVHIHFPDDPDRGDSTRTFDGRTGWIATPLAVVRKYELTGGELDGARLDAQLSFPSQIKQALTNLRVGPPTEIGGRTVQTVQGNGARNSVATLYFDQETGLLTRVVRLTPSAIGRVPTQTDYADYRDVDGIKMPFRIVFSWLDGKDTIELTNIQLNVPIDAAKFGEPDPGGIKVG
jgi:hypothetical protein